MPELLGVNYSQIHPLEVVGGTNFAVHNGQSTVLSNMEVDVHF